MPKNARRQSHPAAAIAATLMASLALAACSYGSMVDVAPMEARAHNSPLAPGAYCEVQAEGPQGEKAPFTIISSEDCIPLEWLADERALRFRESGDPDEEVVAAVAPIGSGVFAAQVTDRSAAPPHQISLFLARGDAFAILPVLDDDKFAALARRHSQIGVTRSDAGRMVIASGDLPRVHRFLADVARASLREMKAEGDALSLGVRDVAGAPDHPASKAQTRDIEELQKRAATLAR